MSETPRLLLIAEIVRDLHTLELPWREVDVDDRNALTSKWRRLEAGAATGAPSGWQPIESAPKDQSLLLWDGFDIHTGRWIELEIAGEWQCDGLCAEEPIAWMPLPAPPEDPQP